MPEPAASVARAPWRCPVCHDPLELVEAERRWACGAGHSFDVAREGYVNLVLGRPRRHQPGDSLEMVASRRRFLATGAYDPLSLAVAAAVAEAKGTVVVDVGCGEGRHTRHLQAPVVLGVDVAKAAIVAAARHHRAAWYAVANAAALPLADRSVDVAVSVFGPVFGAELARVLRPGGLAVVAHPGRGHLSELRALVYEDARPHQLKDPFAGAKEWFEQTGSASLQFPVTTPDAASLRDLFAMTPYRWHGPRDIDDRLAKAAHGPFTTSADIRVTTYRRLGTDESSFR